MKRRQTLKEEVYRRGTKVAEGTLRKSYEGGFLSSLRFKV
jgi:hypothetical protein